MTVEAQQGWPGRSLRRPGEPAGARPFVRGFAEPQPRPPGPSVATPTRSGHCQAEPVCASIPGGVSGENMPECVIYNPEAGRGLARRRIERLRRSGGSFAFFPTAGPGQATELAERAVCDGFTTVIAAGGD